MILLRGTYEEQNLDVRFTLINSSRFVLHLSQLLPPPAVSFYHFISRTELFNGLLSRAAERASKEWQTKSRHSLAVSLMRYACSRVRTYEGRTAEKSTF